MKKLWGCAICIGPDGSNKKIFHSIDELKSHLSTHTLLDKVFFLNYKNMTKYYDSIRDRIDDVISQYCPLDVVEEHTKKSTLRIL